MSDERVSPPTLRADHAHEPAATACAGRCVHVGHVPLVHAEASVAHASHTPVTATVLCRGDVGHAAPGKTAA